MKSVRFLQNVVITTIVTELVDGNLVPQEVIHHVARGELHAIDSFTISGNVADIFFSNEGTIKGMAQVDIGACEFRDTQQIAQAQAEAAQKAGASGCGCGK